METYIVSKSQKNKKSINSYNAEFYLYKHVDWGGDILDFFLNATDYDTYWGIEHLSTFGFSDNISSWKSYSGISGFQTYGVYEDSHYEGHAWSWTPPLLEWSNQGTLGNDWMIWPIKRWDNQISSCKAW